MAEKLVISGEEWRKTLSSVRIPKEQLNNLILNYLITEGYREAAEKFSQESGSHLQFDPEEIEHRMRIRRALMEGNIDEAISAVNEFDAEVLDGNQELLFKLRLQKLIEYIRLGEVHEALAFSQEVLAPAAISNPVLLRSLEEVMSLLAFEYPEQSPMGYLVHKSHLQTVASELNSAILACSGQVQDSKITHLMKMLNWSQRRFRESITIDPN